MMMEVGCSRRGARPTPEAKTSIQRRRGAVGWAVGWEEVVGSIRPFQRLGFVVLFLRQVLST